MNVEAYGETHKETKNMLTHLICDLCFRFNVFQIHVNSDMVVSLFHRHFQCRNVQSTSRILAQPNAKIELNMQLQYHDAGC